MIKMTKKIDLNVLTASFLLLSLAGCTSTPAVGIYSGQKYKDIRYFYMAERLYNACKYDKAIPAFQRYVKLYPEAPLAQVSLYYLGKSYQEQREFVKARKTFETIVEQYGNGFWVDASKRSIDELNYLEKFNQGGGS